jgi:ubiquinone/menaquinone biosynthesis C-methylase UbiE
MKFSDAEQQLIVIIRRVLKGSEIATKENLIRFGADRLGRYILDWELAFNGLIDKGLVLREDNVFKLTSDGEMWADKIHREQPFWFFFYNEYYIRAEESLAHGKFCERVYGKNLCQHGMADMYQLGVLIKLLNLNSSNKVLDLGCGNGYITEYIQEITKANFIGVDLSTVAIERANKRTKQKVESLRFEVGNMNNLAYESNSFDAILSIDTHYFADNLEKLLIKLMDMLLPGGQIGMFSDSGSGISGHDDSNMKPQNTELGRILEKLNFSYTTVNFTERNKTHWNNKEKALYELKDEFKDEDNMFLYNNRLQECTGFNRDLDCRYLYLIRKE